jgi:hypothetical protein
MKKRLVGVAGVLALTVLAQAPKPPAGTGSPALALFFDEGSGELCADQADRAGAGLLRGEAGSPVRVAGVRGNALWFWGERGQGVRVPDRAGLDLADELTVEAWIWVQAFGDHQTVLWKGDRKPAVDAINYRLAIRPEGNLEFSFKGPSDEWWQIMSPAPVPLQQWISVAASFNRGKASLDIGGKRVSEGPLKTFGGDPKATWPGNRMLTNAAPLEIGVGQEPTGEPGQVFCGAIDEVRVWPSAHARAETGLAVAQAPSPLESLRLFEKTFTAEAIRAAPYLVGRVSDARVQWMLEIGFPESKRESVRLPGVNVADGTFRYLLDDYCGAIDLRGAERVSVRGYRCGGTQALAVSNVALQADNHIAEVIVDPDKPLQQIRGFGCYADLPKTFATNPETREREYAPLLDTLREAGVTQLDFSFATQLLEPQNDDADPTHLNWEPLRARFSSEKGLRALAGYLAYVQARGFAVGLRAISFAGWQWDGQGAARSPKSAEVAEACVALLTLLREEGVTPTHLVPVWEPSYPPEAVAEVCAKTARLAKEHGLDLPIVGPYRIATGGQSMDMDAIPDRYLNGQRYVEAYLREMGDAATVIGIEDYASGWSMTEANLKRLQREVIAPAGLGGGQPRELWLLEYGPLCGIGPWNFYPSRWHGAYTGYESAFRLARMVHQELNGGVNNFYFWKAYDGVGDSELISSFGLIKSAQHDRELRPPYHTARVLWKHVPRGARHLSCTSDAGVLANAFVKEAGFTVLLTNPRNCEIGAEIRLPRVKLAPQAFVYSTAEAVAYQERELFLKGDDRVSVTLPPRSVNALVCRAAQEATPFERTVWPEPSEACDYLSDLQWAAVSVAGKRGLERFAINGKGVTVHQDETPASDWLTLNGVRYRKGLGTQTPSEVVYALDGGYATFEALVGVDDATRVSAAFEGAVFAVSVDGKKVFSSEPLKPGQKGLPVQVSCAGAKELRLTVSCAEKVIADWVGARLVR